MFDYVITMTKNCERLAATTMDDQLDDGEVKSGSSNDDGECGDHGVDYD